MNQFQFKVGESMKAFIDSISHEPTKIAMIGPIFSSQTEVLAQTAGYFNLVEVNLLDFILNVNMIYCPCFKLVSYALNRECID